MPSRCSSRVWPQLAATVSALGEEELDASRAAESMSLAGCLAELFVSVSAGVYELIGEDESVRWR